MASQLFTISLLMVINAVNCYYHHQDGDHGQHFLKLGLQIIPGDVISCHINVYARHIMMATSNCSVIHLKADKDNNRGIIREEQSEAIKGFSKCKVVTQSMNVKMRTRFNATSFTVNESLTRARQFANQQVYYHFLNCNCEHWVNYWKYGISFSFQDPGNGKTDPRKCLI